jgi:D-beta-D-heptose 7-phosphate kinase/D-beta-D-heptose 1-phosphate adenosyltransferase
VDYVVVFTEDTPYELISRVKPDILVKGGDYAADEIVGADIVKANGGKVVVIPFVEGKSTSALVEKIKKL